MNAIVISINVPATVIMHYVTEDNDLAFILMLGLMVTTKVLLSIVGSNIRAYMANPRYPQNKYKLDKIQFMQKMKVQQRANILGKDLNRLLPGHDISQPDEAR